MKLEYSHNVIEHLGIKLYQNKPTNVLAELISNAWDAYAKNAYIDIINHKYIAVYDDGFGMTIKELNENYLIIGKHKRENKAENKSLAKKYTRFNEIPNRKPMGRKGIGKLAPFGISSKITLITVSQENESLPKVTWIEFDLSKMNENSKSYEPIIVLENVDYTKEVMLAQFDINKPIVHAINKETIENFTNKITVSGTLILLNNLSLKRNLNDEAIIQAMGRRFTVTLLDKYFNVYVNNNIVDEKSSMPAFEHRIPSEGFSTTSVGGKEVRFWAGFVKSAEWSSDEAGVGVYAHGKIAQERPFTFKSKGREIYTRYMYAVVEADWLDELDQDVISTDRTNINWEAEDLSELSEWGRKKVSEWIKDYLDKRETDDDTENINLVKSTISSKTFTLTVSEQEGIAKLIKRISPSISKDKKTKEEIIETVSQAWTHEPMRKIIQSIWDSIQKNNKHDQFIEIIQNLNNHLIPESLSLAVTFSQRTYALSLLHDLVMLGKEVDLQKLIEKFPWILEHEMELLTADKSLSTIVKEAEQQGLFARRVPLATRGATPKQEPDFVFLSINNRARIVVIEIKNPQKDLLQENLTQLSDYIDFILTRYPKADITGLLIGTNPNDMKTRRTDIEIRAWTEILIKSRSEHLILLASMIKNAAPNDKRVSDVKDFGGEKTWELLNKMAQQDPELKELMEGFEEISKSNLVPNKPTIK